MVLAYIIIDSGILIITFIFDTIEGRFSKLKDRVEIMCHIQKESKNETFGEWLRTGETLHRYVSLKDGK